jgi:hypothetical protein
MSYVMLQPRVLNPMEMKVACWNGGEPYVAMRKRGMGARAFVGCTEDDVLSYATTAIGILKRANPHAILDGLVRVDIFQLEDGRLVVNEFESLEACFVQRKVAAKPILRLRAENDLSASCRPSDNTVIKHLKSYWYDKVVQCLKAFEEIAA